MNDSSGFTTKEIVVRLETKIDKVLEDHEDRIRRIERRKLALPVAAISGILSGTAGVATAILLSQ